MADRLADALATGTATDGLVVGVVGRWGSGKSSLLNLTHAALEKRTTDRPHVIEFKPWLVGDRDSLLQSLFIELASGLDRIEQKAGDTTNLTLSRAKAAASGVREFAASLRGVGTLAKTAGLVVPWVGTFGAFVTGAADAAAKKKTPSLAGLKAKVAGRLKAIPQPLIVVVDDVDRLEPKEIVEVLRLVRSVADFPNVIYVLGYDLEIVAHAVQAAASVQDGHAYMEKIVQITVPVPVPEAFQLRRWFLEELNTLDLTATEEEERRITEIVDLEGGRYLRTPRAVIRTLDSIRFVQAALRGSVDLTDLVWLQLIKVGNSALYDWIVSYMTEISSRSTGRVNISADDIARDRTLLDEVLGREGQTFEIASGRLASFLPGISHYHPAGSDEPGIFEDVSRSEIEQAVNGRRLASPDHYRQFFTFAAPTNTPVIQDYDALAQAMQNSAEETSDLLWSWQALRLTSGVSKTEVMLDRLSHDSNLQFNSVQARNLLMAFANVMDELAGSNINDFGGPDVWRGAQRLLPRLLECLGSERRQVLELMFGQGRAIGWLTSILRRETFSHGRAGDRPSSESERLLTSDELDAVSAIMIARFRANTLDDFAEHPQPLSALYAWQQAGDTEGPQDFLRAESETDDGLVRVLEILGGRVREDSRNGPREIVTLSRQNLRQLIDYDGARSRIERLAESPETNAEFATRVNGILQSFRDGDRF